MDWNEKDAEAYGFYIANGAPLFEETGLTLMHPASAHDQKYWAVLGVFSLPQRENRVAVSLLNEDGQYLGPIKEAVGWTWGGRQEDEVAGPIELKAQPERGGIGLVGSPLSIWAKESGLPSDSLLGIESPCYVVFGRVAAKNPPSDDEPEPGDVAEFIANTIAAIDAQVGKLDLARAALIAIRDSLAEKT